MSDLQSVRQDQRAVATQIAMDAGVLDECEYHPGCFMRGASPADRAYAFATTSMKSESSEGLFASREELMKTVELAIGDVLSDECPHCQHNARE